MDRIVLWIVTCLIVVILGFQFYSIGKCWVDGGTPVKPMIGFGVRCLK